MALDWFRKNKKPHEKAMEPNATVMSDESGSETLEAPKSIASNPKNSDPENSDQDEISAAQDPEKKSESAIPQTRAQGKSLFARLKRGLSKTRDILTTDIEDLFSSQKHLDDDVLEDLEELLITSDIGVQTAMNLMANIRKRASKIHGPEALKDLLKQEILSLLSHLEMPPPPTVNMIPHVIMIVGVNGVGKTTTIGKLAARHVKEGRSVLIAAADTFRAAAVEQLSIWAQKAGAELVKHKPNADPAAVAYDGIEAAVSRQTDVVYVDTAGRLHTKVNLMEELKKIKRIIAKKIPGAPHEIILVLDATTGQNALSQAKLFHEALGVTGMVLTKLDGTAKGGIVISICQSMKIPLHFVGVGEGIQDLQPFLPDQFVEALF
jgi:fused signal recognition particle receptor